MRTVTVPTTDVNSDQAVLTEWMAGDGTPVRKGEVVAEVETSKSVIEVDAPADGFLLHEVAAGAEFDLERPVALLFDSLDELERARRERAAVSTEASARGGNGEKPYRASRSAEELAARHGLDLATIDKRGLITTADVEALVSRQAPTAHADVGPLVVDDGRVRLAIIGAGLGATQVLEILGHDDSQVAVAIVDDDAASWGRTVDGTPVVGGADRLVELFDDGAFDAAVVAISTSVVARTRFRELCEKHDIPLANAIDPTARIASGVAMGVGNVVCAFCHFGVGTTIGDNNFISAYNSYDHHSALGSDTSTGPGCMTSGLVRVGDGVRMGTGIFVEPKVEIGRGCVIASGSVLVRSVPDEHVVKAKAGTTVVSPLRSS